VFADASTDFMSDADVDRESAMPLTDSEFAHAFRNPVVGAVIVDVVEHVLASASLCDVGESVAVVLLSDCAVDNFAVENNPSSFANSESRWFVICDHCARTQCIVARMSSAATRA
jgi:hypothetical protein